MRSLDELPLVLGVELLEHVGLQLLVFQRRHDLLALAVRGGLDQVGELGRVQPGELGVRHAQPHGGDVSGERLDTGPVQKPAGMHAWRPVAGATPAA